MSTTAIVILAVLGGGILLVYLRFLWLKERARPKGQQRGDSGGGVFGLGGDTSGDAGDGGGGGGGDGGGGG